MFETFLLNECDESLNDVLTCLDIDQTTLYYDVIDILEDYCSEHRLALFLCLIQNNFHASDYWLVI